MSILTDQPAIQFYTANMMNDIRGRDGVLFQKYGALCLETGAYNDAVNHPGFPSSILRRGKTYSHTTEHRFDIV